MISIHKMHQIAHDLGVHLQHHDNGVKAWYSPTLHVISTRRDLTVWDYKSSLAHELGHAHYRDHYTNHLHFDQRQERRADEYAARLLIDDADFTDAMIYYDGTLPAVAAELEVTPHVLQTYLNLKAKEQAA